MDTKKAGVLAMLGASIMWAIEPVLAKLAYINSNFLETSAIRAIFVALVAALYIIIANKANFKLSKNKIPKIVYVALVGTLFADLMYFFALTKVPVINAVLLGHMMPIFIILIGFFVLKEDRLTKFDYTGIAIMILAGLLVTTRTMANLSALKFGTTGDLLVLVATIAWSTTAIVARKYLVDINSGVVTFYRFSLASVVFITYLLATSSLKTANTYQVGVGIAVGIGSILYYEGLKRIKAAAVSSLELSTPFFATILGYAVLGEGATAMQISGIALLFAGVYFLSRKEEQ